MGSSLRLTDNRHASEFEHQCSYDSDIRFPHSGRGWVEKTRMRDGAKEIKVKETERLGAIRELRPVWSDLMSAKSH